MPASSSHRLLSSTLVALAAVCLEGVEAADVYFPASSAYHRRNYDPFDQATPAATESRAPKSGELDSTELAEVKQSSEIRVVGADPFEHFSPEPAGHVAPAAFQGAAPAALEPLPAPPSAQVPAAAPDEPGADWSPKPLSELSTNTLPPAGVLPRNYWGERAPQHVACFDPCGTTRGWPVNSFNWVASCLCHNPLYFEEINLERYGYGCCECLQPAASAAHFFATVPALPYMMAVDCPGECDYALGHYRPGSCPPRRHHCCTRCSALGGLSAGGVATGLVFLIP